MESIVERSPEADLEQIEQQLQDLQQHPINLTPSATYTTASRTSIAPLLKTKWGQSTPFNNMCPENGNGGRCVEMHGKTFSIPAPGKMEDVVEGGGCCLAVRPESILLSATEGHLPGTISRATYYGTKVEYEVMLGEQPIIVEVYNPQLSERFTEGQEVRMTLIDRCVRVLK